MTGGAPAPGAPVVGTPLFVAGFQGFKILLMIRWAIILGQHSEGVAGWDVGLWELCSKFLLLFYSEFPLKFLHYAHKFPHYAHIYSFYFMFQ